MRKPIVALIWLAIYWIWYVCKGFKFFKLSHFVLNVQWWLGGRSGRKVKKIYACDQPTTYYEYNEIMKQSSLLLLIAFESVPETIFGCHYFIYFCFLPKDQRNHNFFKMRHPSINITTANSQACVYQIYHEFTIGMIWLQCCSVTFYFI